MNQLYENIKRYRKQAGLTQDELAKKAGYTDRSSIAKIESGHVDLTQSKIKQFADIFDVSPSELMGLADGGSSSPLPAGLLPVEMRRMDNKDVFARNLLHYMELRGKSRRDVCEDLGFSYYTFSDWVNGKKYPRMDKVEMLAKYFGIKKSDLIEDVPTEQCFTADHRPLPVGLLSVEMRRVPILGPMAAGVPILTEPEYGEYAALPEETRHVDAALRVEGDSMIPRYLDGDLVLIRYQQDVDDGQIAAVCVDDSITLKHVYHLKNGVQLTSENAKYPPMIYTAENSDCVHVLGLAVGYLRWDR